MAEHKLTEKEEKKGGEHSHAHHMAEAKKHAGHLHKMAKAKSK